MEENKKEISVLLRLKLIVTDYFIMMFISFGIMLPIIIYKIIIVSNINHEPLNNGFSGIFFSLILGITTYLNKDIFNGQSPGKRIFKLQVIDEQTNLPTSSFKCFLRNITLLIFPIEFIFILVNPNKRIGDFMVLTRLDHYQTNNNSIITWKSKLMSIVAQALISFVLVLPLIYLESGRNSNKIQYVEESYNQEESKEASSLFNKEFNNIIKQTDFRMYDKIKNDNRKYMSGILYFRNEKDYDNLDNIEIEISKFLNKSYPLENYTCYLKYVYQESGKLKVSQKLFEK